MLTCVTCGEAGPESDAFCRHCGSPLTVKEPVPEGETSAGETPISGGDVAAEAGGAGPPVRLAVKDPPAKRIGDQPGATRACRACGEPLAEGVHFCAACGARQAIVAKAERALAEDVPPAPSLAHLESSRAGSQPASATSSSTTGAPVVPSTSATGGPSASSAGSASVQAGEFAQKMLLPRFPCRLVWSPRKPWEVKTSLPEEQVARLFTERMTSNANLLRKFNDYFRRARWEVQRNAISGELIAKCNPTGQVSVGFGKNKFYVDVSNDTMCCQINQPNPKSPTDVAIGPGTYTTLFGLYAYPAPVYSFDIVKAIKRADRDATVKYPWSPARMIMLAATIILLIIAASSSSSNNNTTNATFTPTPTEQQQDNPAAETPTTAEAPTTTETTPTTSQTTGTEPSSLSPPARTIKEHLEKLGDGDDAGAFALMSERYRSTNPNWTANRETADPEVHIVGVGKARFNQGSARVYVKFYARDRVATPGSDTRCRLFQGTVLLVAHGGIWRYEPSGNSLSGAVRHGACGT
jgi:hypothetical protein